jgi:hypothetical protein
MEQETATGVRIAPGHEDRLPAAGTVLIVTGTSNASAAAEAAPADTVVVGMDEPGSWISEAGLPDPAIQDLVAGKHLQVVLAFENRDTDGQAWEHASRLSKYLKALGAKKVKFTDSGFPIALLLMSIDEREGRVSRIVNLVENAGTIGQRPAANKSKEEEAPDISLAPIVDTALGSTYSVSREGFKTVWMEAAVSRIRTHRVYDDLRDPRMKKAFLVHDLSITVQTPEGIKDYEVAGVNDSDLTNPRVYLNRVPHGSSIVVSTEYGANAQIGAAIRGHDPALVPELRTLRRTGWAQDDSTWGFVHPDGFATANGRTDAMKCVIAEALMDIVIEDTAAFPDGTELRAAQNTLAIMNDLTDLNLFVAYWGCGFSSVANLPVGAVPTVTGKKGSGKTVLAMAIGAHLAHKYAISNMLVIDQSAKNVAKAGDGLHNLWLLADDMRRRGSSHKADAQADALEHLIRPGYAGASAKYAGNAFDRVTQEWSRGIPDQSSPAIMIAGEQLPDSDNLESSLERLYAAPIARGANIFRSGNARKVEELSANGLPSTHLAFFIRWIAQQIQDLGSMDAWTAKWIKTREEIADSRSDLPVSTRVRTVAAVPETGIRIWAEYLLSIGALTQGEHDDLLFRTNKVVTANAYVHGTTTVEANDVLEYDAILNSLRAAVATGSAYVHGVDAEAMTPGELPYNVVFLGVEKRSRGGGESFLAMQPRDVLKILRTESRHQSLTEGGLRQAFAEISLTDANRNDKKVRINGQLTYALAIPMSVWAPTEDPEVESE